MSVAGGAASDTCGPHRGSEPAGGEPAEDMVLVEEGPRPHAYAGRAVEPQHPHGDPLLRVRSGRIAPDRRGIRPVLPGAGALGHDANAVAAPRDLLRQLVEVDLAAADARRVQE